MRIKDAESEGDRMESAAGQRENFMQITFNVGKFASPSITNEWEMPSHAPCAVNEAPPRMASKRVRERRQVQRGCRVEIALGLSRH